MWCRQRSQAVSAREALSWRGVGEDLAVRGADVLDADRRVVEPDGVTADDVGADELVDGAVGVDHEVGAGAGQLVQLAVGHVLGEGVVGRLEGGARRVVLDDHVGMSQSPGVDAVVALGIGGGLGPPGGAERDWLPHDRRPRHPHLGLHRWRGRGGRRRGRRRRRGGGLSGGRGGAGCGRLGRGRCLRRRGRLVRAAAHQHHQCHRYPAHGWDATSARG